ncbi:hypothetical protein O181_009799 [Austropuccinia psidii MF-1]|uniref:Reverse transcriptase/retrotransposon-derived protein RNase H-like domain-containing protein n=1 Tax=Austropuccinia psidii MF-1 TaxID=1389203 RepID=A0A9Q3BPX0_9BASI|nr:hypothetical protein [Austropuccinia psidii MF-1]
MKVNISLKPQFVVLEDAHIQQFLLGTDYQRMYGIDIYNSKNRYISIGTNKEKKFSLDIYQISTNEPLGELLNELREGKFSTSLTSKQKDSLLKILRKNRTVFSIAISLYKLCSKDVVFEITKERRDAYERIKHELTNSPVLTLPEFGLPFKLYIDTACSQGLGAALQERQTVDGEPRKGVICYTSRKPEESEARYGSTQTECLCLVWALDKLH